MGLGYVVYMYFFALIVALQEIQIEGKDGWAKNLPCWRPEEGTLVYKIGSFLLGGRELTGFHLVSWILHFGIAHFPFTVTNWTIEKEFFILSVLALFWATEDFLWFVWNPDYGIEKFRDSDIEWHENWIWRIPVDYFVAVFFYILFGLLAQITPIDLFLYLFLFVLLTLINIELNKKPE